jgi:hypothetical protein
MPYTLPPHDLEQLGTYIFGPRWQTALGHALHRDPRLVRRWLAGDRHATRHASELIEALALGRHAERLRRPNTDFLLMVAGLSNGARKMRMLDNRHLSALQIEDQVRRAAIVVPAAAATVAAPTVDYAPHNVPSCVSCPMYLAAAKMSVKSRPFAPVALNGATPASVPPVLRWAGSSLP